MIREPFVYVLFFLALADIFVSYLFFEEGQAYFAAFVLTVSLYGIWTIRKAFSELITRLSYWLLRREIPKIMASFKKHDMKIKIQTSCEG
ncbi:hypothetical protein [Dryocola clanedunensis]